MFASRATASSRVSPVFAIQNDIGGCAGWSYDRQAYLAVSLPCPFGILVLSCVRLCLDDPALADANPTKQHPAGILVEIIPFPKPAHSEPHFICQVQKLAAVTRSRYILAGLPPPLFWSSAPASGCTSAQAR
jgi:hypothetical protein